MVNANVLPVRNWGIQEVVFQTSIALKVNTMMGIICVFLVQKTVNNARILQEIVFSVILVTLCQL